MALRNPFTSIANLWRSKWTAVRSPAGSLTNPLHADNTVAPICPSKILEERNIPVNELNEHDLLVAPVEDDPKLGPIQKHARRIIFADADDSRKWKKEKGLQDEPKRPFSEGEVRLGVRGWPTTEENYNKPDDDWYREYTRITGGYRPEMVAFLKSISALPRDNKHKAVWAEGKLDNGSPAITIAIAAKDKNDRTQITQLLTQAHRAGFVIISKSGDAHPIANKGHATFRSEKRRADGTLAQPASWQFTLAAPEGEPGHLACLRDVLLTGQELRRPQPGVFKRARAAIFRMDDKDGNFKGMGV